MEGRQTQFQLRVQKLLFLFVWSILSCVTAEYGKLSLLINPSCPKLHDLFILIANSDY